MRGKLAQQRNTHFQCGNAFWYGGWLQIVAMDISYEVSYI